MADSILDAIIPAASGLLGALLGSIVPFLLNRKVSRAEYELKLAELDKTSSYRFGEAVARLQNDSLGVRMGALFELKKLGLESKTDQEIIVQILSPFIKEHMKPQHLLESEHFLGDRQRPDWDVYIACEMAALFFMDTNCMISLAFLQASGLDLYKFSLDGARLQAADFRGTILRRAKLKGVDLDRAKLQGANFTAGADLRGAKNLTAAQLLEAIIDDTTKLDPDLRAEYDRLKAEQDAKKEA